MTQSLRDQLLQLGFKPAPKAAPKPPTQREAKPAVPKPGRGNGQSAGKPGRQGRAPERARAARAGEIDLAKAYALRSQQEKAELRAAEQARQEAARQRREARTRLQALLKDKALNDPTAERARHFEYSGKIRRVHVTDDQLRSLNAGELGVVQLDGRYLLVAAAVLDEAAAIMPSAVALRVGPQAACADAADADADPQFRVPDDLIW